MAINADQYLLVPFGIDRLPAVEIDVQRAPDGGLRALAPFPCAVIDAAARQPLRLNNSNYELAFKPLDEADPDPVDTLRDCIKLECDAWNRKALAFLDGYFDALNKAVLLEEAAIARQAVGFGRLYEARDWIFSALRPLPRAHLDMANGEPVVVDFAFWTGERLLALDLSFSELMPAAAKERQRRLGEAGIQILSAVPDGEAAWSAFIAGLAPSGAAFWHGEVLPLGPFRSTALDALHIP